MVKRPKSPEITEDARYFTVYQPYPLNANWIIEEEQMRCAMWVAECIGMHHLWAIHYKPKARGMILLEISKTYSDHGDFLGEHRWAEILKKPTDEERQSVSQVFHSFYTKGRDAQKDGWKVLPVKAKWFKDWVPGKGPYPPTHWCSVPVEDRTNKPLCRPLPVETKPPPPPRTQLPVVGSSKWVEKQVEVQPNPADAWAIKRPGVSPPVVGVARSSSLNQNQPSVVLAPQPAESGNNNPRQPGVPAPTATPTQAKGSWGKPIPLQKFNAPERSTKTSTWAPVQPATGAGAKSPLVDPQPNGPVNAWAKALKIVPSEKSQPKSTSTPSSEANSPWAQTAPLEPPSSWSQPAILAPATSAAPRSNEPWGIKATEKKRRGKKAQGNIAVTADTKTNGQDQPQVEQNQKFIWADEPADFPASSGPIPEFGEEETVEDPLSKAKGKAHGGNGNGARQVDKPGRNPAGGSAQGNGGVKGKVSAWGAGQAGKAGNNKKGPAPAVKYDWTVQPTASTSWGDMPIETADWTAGVSESNSWGDMPITAGPDAGPPEKPAAEAWAPTANGGGVPDVDVDWEGTPNSHSEYAGATGHVEWHHEEWREDPDWDTELPSDKPPELICPTHNITCKKGICRDMARLVREKERKEREKEFAEKKAGRGKGKDKKGGVGSFNGRGGGNWRGLGLGGGGGWSGEGTQTTDTDAFSVVETGEEEQEDDDGFTKRKTRRGKKKEPSFIGRMRGFEDEPEASGTASSGFEGGTSTNGAEGTEADDAEDEEYQNQPEPQYLWADDDLY